MKKLFLSLIGLSFMAVASSQGMPFPVSRVVTDTIHSKVLNAPRAYDVYIPASFDFDKTKEYPVLYLLHGMWGKNDDWTGRGHLKEVADRLVASGEADEMIIVTPDAGGGNPEEFQNGYFNMPGWDYETFFFDELMPAVEKKYRVKGDKKHRAVAGLSMGGGGATSYGQRHADKFGAVYAMSALMHLPEAAADKVLSGDKTALLTDAVHRLSCVEYVRTADDAARNALRSVAWFVDCGDDDFLFDCNIDFVKAMRAAWIPCELRVRDGGHTWEYWHSALYTALPFVSRKFGFM